MTELILLSTSTIKSAIRLLNKSKSKIVFIVDTNKKMVGTVTDGDIRRGILKSIKIDDSIKRIMCKDFDFISDKTSEKNILKILNKHKQSHVPLLNKSGQIIKILDNIKYNQHFNTPVVIMAGGKGIRMRPLTKNTPKPMLKINGIPILEILLSNISKEGFKKIYLSVNYLKSKIKKHFGNGSKNNVQIEYIEEKKPLGTMGSVKMIENQITKNFILINGDILTKVNLTSILEQHIISKSDITICTREKISEIPYGVIEIKNGYMKSFDEKPEIKYNFNAGIYIFKKNILKLNCFKNKCDITEVFKEALTKNKKISVFPIFEYWLDIGNIQNFEKANFEWE